MEVVDCHTHIFMHPEKDRILRSLENILIVENGLDSKTNKVVLEESKKYDNVFCAVGLHPTNVLRYPKEDLIKMINDLVLILGNRSEKVLAIGEIGLDYYWVKEAKLRKLEIELLYKILEISKEFNLPIIIHSRNSEKDIYEILENYDGIIILHSYMGKIKIAKKFLELNNVYFSIPAIVYRLKELQRLVEIIPENKILTETDTPFLSPIKGLKNEPKFVEYGISKIAEIKEISKEELREIVLKNFKDVFNI